VSELDLGAQQPGLDASGRSREQAAGMKKEARHQASVARLVGTLRSPDRAPTGLSDAFTRPHKGRRTSR